MGIFSLLLLLLLCAYVAVSVLSVDLITSIAGSGVAGYSGDGDAATAAQLSGPFGIALDASGKRGDMINYDIFLRRYLLGNR